MKNFRNFFINLFKNYKKLYFGEKENVKKLTNQNTKLSREREDMEIELKKVQLELEDTKGFLAQEKECSNALRKERTKLRKKVTKLGGKWQDGE